MARELCHRGTQPSLELLIELTTNLRLVGDDFLRTMGHPNPTVQGTLTSVYNLGCFGGSLSTLYYGDKLGRPRTIMLGSSVIAIGAIIQSTCFSRGQMFAGRVIAGSVDNADAARPPLHFEHGRLN